MPHAQYLTYNYETHTQKTKFCTISHVIWILYEEVMTVLPGTHVY
jgi:hypothetical protein